MVEVYSMISRNEMEKFRCSEHIKFFFRFSLKQKIMTIAILLFLAYLNSRSEKYLHLYNCIPDVLSSFIYKKNIAVNVYCHKDCLWGWEQMWDMFAYPSEWSSLAVLKIIILCSPFFSLLNFWELLISMEDKAIKTSVAYDSRNKGSNWL